MASFTLLIGGVRSGKSSLATDIGRRHQAGGGCVVIVATAEPSDHEMAERIHRHRADRPSWPVIEEPLDLAGAIAAAPGEAMVIVDCLTVWLNNMLHHRGAFDPATDASPVVDALVGRAGPAVVITNEVGLGVVPATPLGRRYRDDLGALNQRVAAVATTTLLLVAGRAMPLHDPWEYL